jgi:hypothetical protein
MAIPCIYQHGGKWLDANPNAFYWYFQTCTTDSRRLPIHQEFGVAREALSLAIHSLESTRSNLIKCGTLDRREYRYTTWYN